jgi:DNA-binding HxlR family transcriptional regulator
VTTATRITPRRCSIAAALEVVGEKWSLLVVRELFLGQRRFSDIAANTGAPRDILTARLRRLEEVGVITRRAYSEHPPRYEYVLTDAGKDLRPVILSLKHWGDTHVMHESLAPVLQHSCGAAFEPRLACAACGEVIHDPRTLVTATAGTPADDPAPATSARRRRSRRSPATG